MIISSETGLGYDNQAPISKCILDNSIKNVELSNAIFDKFLISTDLNYYNNDNVYPEEFDRDTIIECEFNNTVAAGNVPFDKTNTDLIIIKRRQTGSYTWDSIGKIDIYDNVDLKIQYSDKYARNDTEYDYAIVQVKDNSEKNFIVENCKSEFREYFIMDANEKYKIFCDVKLDKQINSNRTSVPGLNKKYPTIINNSSSKYISGSITATVVGMKDCCEISDDNAWKLRDKFYEFLLNGMPKAIKTFDNRLYAIIDIVDAISEAPGDYWKLPTTTFSFVQVGEIDSEKDMCLSGLSDIDESWWSE